MKHSSIFIRLPPRSTKASRRCCMAEDLSVSAGNSWRDQFRFSYLNSNLREFLSVPPQLSAIFQLPVTVLRTSKYSSEASPGFPVQLLALTQFSRSPHIDPTPLQKPGRHRPKSEPQPTAGTGFISARWSRYLLPQPSSQIQFAHVWFSHVESIGEALGPHLYLKSQSYIYITGCTGILVVYGDGQQLRTQVICLRTWLLNKYQPVMTAWNPVSSSACLSTWTQHFEASCIKSHPVFLPSLD